MYTLVKMRPSVLHLGHKGSMLLARFLSIPKGFRFLQDANYITQELEKWHEVSNKNCALLYNYVLRQWGGIQLNPCRHIQLAKYSKILLIFVVALYIAY